MKVTFNLSDSDLKYFRKLMTDVRTRHEKTPEAEIVANARALLRAMESSSVPDFISERIESLRQLIDMLEDHEWALSGKDRERVVRGMAYFAEPEDMIPDRVPVLGFLDDAIMVELVVGELVHEIDAYRDFCEFRRIHEERFGKEDPATRDEWLVARRTSLHQRMRRRRTRRRERTGPGPRTSRRSPIGLW